jgi:hypothetical protein
MGSWRERRIWQRRFYDFVVRSEGKRVEKLWSGDGERTAAGGVEDAKPITEIPGGRLPWCPPFNEPRVGQPHLFRVYCPRKGVPALIPI